HAARRNLALVMLERGEAAAAVPLMQRHLEDYHAGPRNAMSEAGLNLVLGRALLATGQAGAALPHLQRSVDVLGEVYPRSPGLANARSWLALGLLGSGDRAGAAALAERAAATFAAQPSAGVHYRRGFMLLERRLAE
ncbi:MAG TPA: hypothetical protein VK824_05045, partial [Planctomycetota bacterium]|nr:hypothetical protein [Planctomycetota bacterium]